MYLQTTDLIAIMIALGGSCTVMVVSINAHRNLLKENRFLREQLKKERIKNAQTSIA
jgi:heme exporter protein D